MANRKNPYQLFQAFVEAYQNAVENCQYGRSDIERTNYIFDTMLQNLQSSNTIFENMIVVPNINAISKFDEMLLLEPFARNGNTYMATLIGEEDMRKCINNIRNDFPIIMGTALGEQILGFEKLLQLQMEQIVNKATELEQLNIAFSRLADQDSSRQELIETMAVKLLTKNPDAKRVYEWLDKEEIVKIKLKNRLELSHADRELLINKL